ncbi:MAG: hypothetical protein MMC23_004438 [Stictis urceolatum]|nr:hypothetical protein [Stictis urceolata]
MRFTSIIATLSLSAFVAAAPFPASATFEKRLTCKSTVTDDLDAFLEKVVPELKPLLEGVDGTETELGRAIPALGEVLDLLDSLCL